MPTSREVDRFSAPTGSERVYLLPLSGVPRHPSRRNDHHDVVLALERRNEFRKVVADDGNRVGLLAVEPHMTSYRVLHSPPRELAVMGDQHRLPVVGIDRDGIVVGGCGETGRGWPALVPSLGEAPRRPGRRRRGPRRSALGDVCVATCCLDVRLGQLGEGLKDLVDR